MITVGVTGVPQAISPIVHLQGQQVGLLCVCVSVCVYVYVCACLCVYVCLSNCLPVYIYVY